MTEPVDRDAETRLDQELLDVDGVASTRPDSVARALHREPLPASARPVVTPWVTYALIAANVIAFGLEVVAGADPMSPTAQKLVEV